MDRFIVDDFISREQELENLKSSMDRFIEISKNVLTNSTA